MRLYIDIVAHYIAEAIIAELDTITALDNVAHEIGSAGTAVDAHVHDMLPHNGISQRNKSQAYAEIFAKARGDTHNDSFEREPAPVPQSIRARRNNTSGGIKSLKPIPSDCNASALLHSDYANRKPLTSAIIPSFKKPQRF